MSYKKRSWLITGALILVFALVIGAFVRIGNMETNKKLTIGDYQVATINATGKISESKQNIVTKDLLQLEDIEITLDEDATISYKVYYYDEDEKFISASDTLTSDYEVENVSNAKYVRVLITPALVDGEPAEVSVFNMGNYTSQISIVIAK